MEDQERDKEEFKHAMELHRLEAGIMLGQVAIYLVASGALLNASFTAGKNHFALEMLILKIFGIILSMLFFITISRSGENCTKARKRAWELGNNLGFKVYDIEHRAPDRKVRGTSATQGICLIGGIIWIVFLIKGIFIYIYK